MIFHLSLPARRPQHAACVVADLWGGQALPFPPVMNAWIAMADDERRSAIEFYPDGMALFPAFGARDAEGRRIAAVPSGHHAGHAAIATPLEEKAVHDIARREGWTAKTLNRGGLFRVVEFWVEDRTLLEVLTAEMQSEYLATMTSAHWAAFLDDHGGAA
ncbi:hypothetical protein [Allosphingosinicella indica]|uniref:Uncharacterized protein n=1 Tax=Allosphingosinicella indica TaxID=941907 RepID=A0A1X7FYF2_9SPHN|nr:hypothetical protein [Allosphingosinicella indica]SMF61129.1 hypothetical protein SAMN06295910_0136 [Allosphingosinicella indica]